MPMNDDTRIMLNSLHLLLPPGPWHAQGNKVMAGSVNVATVFAGPRQAATARAIADLYSLLSLCVEQADAIKALEAQVEKLTDRLDEVTEQPF